MEKQEEIIKLKFEVIEEKISDLKEEISEIKKLLTGHIWKAVLLLVLLAGFAGERVETLINSFIPDSIAAEVPEESAS